MAMVKDVVCGMMVNTEAAPAKTEYKGKTYYFCAQGCKAAFEKDPEKYLQVTPEAHESQHRHGHCC